VGYGVTYVVPLGYSVRRVVLLIYEGTKSRAHICVTIWCFHLIFLSLSIISVLFVINFLLVYYSKVLMLGVRDRTGNMHYPEFCRFLN